MNAQEADLARMFFACLFVPLLLAGCAQPTTPPPGLPDGFVLGGRQRIESSIRPRQSMTLLRDVEIEVAAKLPPGTRSDGVDALDLRISHKSELALVPGTVLRATLAMSDMDLRIAQFVLTDAERAELKSQKFDSSIDWDADCRNPRVANLQVRGGMSLDISKFESYIKAQEAESSIVCFANGIEVDRIATVPTRQFLAGEMFRSLGDKIEGSTRIRSAGIGTFLGREAFVLLMNGDVRIVEGSGTITGPYRAHLVFDAASGAVLDMNMSYALAGKDGRGQAFGLSAAARVRTREIR